MAWLHALHTAWTHHDAIAQPVAYCALLSLSCAVQPSDISNFGIRYSIQIGQAFGWVGPTAIPRCLDFTFVMDHIHFYFGAGCGNIVR